MEQNWALLRKKTTLEMRARIIQTIRAFFVERGYLEVETPHRIPANAPEIHIDAVASGDWFLQTSPELCMKRLLAAGYEKIFQLCRVWRGDERGGRHLPEFTLLEWYRTGVDYRALMEECEALLRRLCGDALTWKGEWVALAPPWERLTVDEAFRRHASVSLDEALASKRFNEVLAFEVEPRLGRGVPTFLCDYPLSLAALARRSPSNPEVAERFELYICGIELANAFSELTDPAEQRQRFETDEARRRADGKVPYPIPDRFLDELSTMPESAGIALGLDRLVMLLADAEKIDDIVAFPPEIL